MKRILLTLLQLSVTTAMLWWVFHDHQQRDRRQYERQYSAAERANRIDYAAPAASPAPAELRCQEHRHRLRRDLQWSRR